VSDNLILATLTTEWLTFAAMIVVTVITTAVTVTTCLWKLVRRLEKTEDGNAAIHEVLKRFGDNLQKHQEEDCVQLTKLHEEVAALKEPVTKIDEAVHWIKETLKNDRTYVHERIAEHDARNREQVEANNKEFERMFAELRKELDEANAEIANLKAERADKARTARRTGK
jgi:peptidoglycan hydrolase CwlO-like protein